MVCVNLFVYETFVKMKMTAGQDTLLFVESVQETIIVL